MTKNIRIGTKNMKIRYILLSYILLSVLIRGLYVISEIYLFDQFEEFLFNRTNIILILPLVWNIALSGFYLFINRRLLAKQKVFLLITFNLIALFDMYLIGYGILRD